MASVYAAAQRPGLKPLLAGADVVHVLGGDLLAVAAVDAAHRTRIPAVVSPFAHPGQWGDDAASARAYREAELVLATTEADAAVYRGLGVPAERVRVVGLPVPGVEGNGEPEAGLVLVLGARRPTKGIDLMLAAAGELWARRPEARFAFVGPGDPLPSNDPRVLDVGEVSEAERAAWLRRAAVLCLPSESESFGLVVAEAWSAGVPVVASDIPVLRELVAAAGGGLLAAREPAAMAGALDRLLADPAAARRMGAAGREHWARHLQPRAVADAYVALYREAGAGRAG
jgi:glycosyltransferase involved in cell wall biosynthesis